MSSTKITGFVPFGPVGASGMSNHMRVYQKNGRDFFRLSDIAGAPPIQRAAAGAPASGSAYASTVQSLREQIQTSATSRSLLDRVRDPKNHTAKTQILQLVQLIAEEEKQGLSGGEADRALLALMEDSSTRPLLTSALASAMGGAPWVAERNTKIADGVLNMNTLASDAIRTCIWLGRMPREISKDAGEIFSQLRSHGAFSFSPSRLLKGLQKLSPGLRCEFYRLALNSGQRTLPPIQVFLAAKAKASWDDFFAAIKETDVNKRLELYNSIKASGQTNLPPIQDFVVCKSGAKPDEFFAAIKDMSARDRLKLVNYVKADRVQYPAYQSLVPGDVIAGKQNAKPEEFWDVILKEYP
ncbi:MAG: hypothetical protein LBD40_00635, partial [Puniceicoccales bacterium]|nr:hypothetical protein [Puniceicoccales bacterium]